MRTENPERLAAFLETVDANIRTTRRASEVFYDCPTVEDAVHGQHDIKATLDAVYSDFASDQETELPEAELTVEGIKDSYWCRAQRVPGIYGAKPYTSVEDYFHVDQDRDVFSIKEDIRTRYPVGSIPSSVLTSIETYEAALGISSMDSSRMVMTLLKAQLPALKKHAEDAVATDDYNETEATAEAFRFFAAATVPEHINAVHAQLAAGTPLTAMHNKRSFYPTPARCSTTCW